MIRLARAEEAALLPAIEHDSDQTMRETRYAYIADLDPVAPDHYQEPMTAGTTWVAVDDDDRPVGFAACGVKPDGLVVYQLSVMRAAQKRGLGTALMRTAIDWARSHGHSRVMLTTFIDVIFNAPFYEGLGFVTLEQAHLPPSLAHMLAHEAEQGHDPTKRVAMVLALDEASA